MADIERVVYEALLRGGAPQPERWTRIVSDCIRREYGGSALYVDRGLAGRNRAILAEVDSGTPVGRVAARYQLSISRVKRIVHGWP